MGSRYENDYLRNPVPYQKYRELDLGDNRGKATLWLARYYKEITADRYFPFFEIRTSQPGFFLGVNSGTHGGEDSSVYTALEIFEMLKNNQDRGRSVIIPIANPDSIVTGQRFIRYQSPGDVNDLNRAFKKENPVTPIEKHADTILRIFEKSFQENLNYDPGLNHHGYPGLVLDLHTEIFNSGSNEILPYTRIDDTSDDKLLFFEMLCAEVLGVPWVMEYKSEEYKQYGLDTSLSGVLGQLGVPALTIELGPLGRISPSFVNIGKAMTYNILKRFKMIKKNGVVDESVQEGLKTLKEIKEKAICQASKQPLRLADANCFDKNGQKVSLGMLDILELTVNPGDAVKAGQIIGNIRSPLVLDGSKTHVYAPFDSCVLSTEGAVTWRVKNNQPVYQAAVAETDSRIIGIYNQVQEFLQTLADRES